MDSLTSVILAPVITAVLPFERAVEAFALASDKSQSLKVQIAFAEAATT